ncbi:protein-disulfide reductase DsbD [Roseixanthobacter liquoris]|uniref:protein-disulfide reductase DsbD n=1 Tax=Roseixanthobacter liquoris TaxID=3119921 RepID=UPI0037261AAD
MVMRTLQILQSTLRYAICALLLPAIAGTAMAASLRDPLAPDDAFRLSASRTADGTLTLSWRIAAGTYLYRESLKAEREGRSVTLATLPGESKDDPNFGAVEIYHGEADATVPGLPAQGQLRVAFQGCAEAGICYPEIARTVDLATLRVEASTTGLRLPEAGAPTTAAAPPPAMAAAMDPAAPAPAAGGFDADTSALFDRSAPMLLATFLGFGLLLAFTPCVFPMLPILSGILAGGGERPSPVRGFVLSASYGLAMAVAYGVLGLAAGWSGANLQLALQTPWALGAMAAAFLALSLSMFGVFELALPRGLKVPFMAGERRAGGSVAGAAMLGFSSALVVGPCVTPPLAAAILYAAQSGDALRGGAALFMLGLGMALPLVLVCASGARMLPRSGPWMVVVRQACGVLFLGIAVLLASRLLNAAAGVALWGALAIGLGVFLGAFNRPGRRPLARLAKALGLLGVIYGGTLVVGAAGGAEDPLRPLAFLGPAARPQAAPRENARVSSTAAFQQALAKARAEERPVLVSFTADWCTVCKSNEKVMDDPALRQRMADLPRIEADVTAYGADTQALMQRFGVVGPPTLFLIGADGRERDGSRLIGAVSRTDIEQLIAKAGS